PCRVLGSAIEKLKTLMGHVSALSVGQANPHTAGTLGGILRSSNSAKHYAVSCNHVLGSVGTAVYRPGPFEGRKSARIGEFAFSELAISTPPGMSFNSRAMPDAKRLDVAVAELTRDTAAIVSDVSSTVQVDGVRPVANIAPSNQVFFYGKESGP